MAINASGDCHICPKEGGGSDYCGETFRGSFDRAKDEVRCKVASSNYTAPLVFAPSPSMKGNSSRPSYVVAWHLRVGDITIQHDRVSGDYSVQEAIADF
jgi:hypothetical protein